MGRTGGDSAGGRGARSHVAASLRACIREDGSTFHAVRFADDGRIVERGTVNGLAPGSTWARGQAWTICGLVSAYRATGDREILAAAEQTAGFCDRLPLERIPTWDFDAAPGAPTDSSAAAIVASALLDLDGEWRTGDWSSSGALVTRCLNRGKEDGLLLHGCYRYTVGEGVDCATAWGDFFLLDALVHAVRPEARLDPLADGG